MQIEELMNNAALTTAILGAETKEQLADALISCGVVLSDEELEQVFSEPKNGELDEDLLESVSGGSRLSSLRNFINALRYKAGGSGFNKCGGGGGAFGGGGGGGR